MKKYTLILICLFGFAVFSKAQPPKYDDLVILLADGKYEKLIDQSLRYNDKSSTTQDPFPYLMLAKGYYQMSLKGDRSEEYKNAFKMSVNAIRKFIRKDKGGEMVAEHSEFIEQVKATAAEALINEYETEDFRKVRSSASVYNKVSPENEGANFINAASSFMQKDASSANFIWKDAIPNFLKMEDLGTDSPSDIKVYKAGIIATAKCLIQARQMDKARSILEKGAELIQEEDFKKQINELM